MKLKSLVGVALTLAVAGALTIAPAAFADEVEGTPPVESTQEAISATPEAQAAVTESKPAPAETKLAICHSGSGKNWTYIAPDASGYNGHKNHEADIYGLSEADCLAKNAVVTPVYKTLSWVMPNGGTGSNVTWDQVGPVDPSTYVAECGAVVTLQNDTYPYTTEADKARTDALGADGKLTQGEDYGWAISWTFTTVTGPVCTVPAQTCVAGGAYHESDDNLATLSEAGLEIRSLGNGKATDGAGFLTTGNAQGITSFDYVVTNTTVNAAYARFIFDLTADGGSSYNSFSGLPTHVDQTTVAGYGSKAVFTGKSLGDVGTTWPHNKLVAVIFQTGSSWLEGQGSTLVSYSGACGQALLTPVIPEPSTRQTVTTTDLVCTVNDDDTLPGGGTTTTTTTDYETHGVWNAETFSYDMVESQVGEPVTVTNTVDDLEACPATVVVPPTEPPTTTEPPVQPEPVASVDKLAYTGSDPFGGILAAALLLLAGLGFGGVALLRKRREV